MSPQLPTSTLPRRGWGVDDVAGAVRAAIEAGSTEHTAPSAVGDGIVTATVRTPQHTIVGFIYNPHFDTA